MKIIILTGRFGMGHMTAALAVQQQIESCQIEADIEVIDWLEYISPKFANKYYAFFNLFVEKGRKLYNTRYRFLENRKVDQKPEFHTFLQRYLLKLMDEKKPDLMISTLPVCSQITSMYKEETGSYIPLITYVTDITGHSEWINKNTDFYCVGSHTVAEKFISKGVAPGKIFETGLPVRAEFLQAASSNRDNEAAEKKHLLIMGGGLGMLPKAADFYRGLEQLPDTEVIVITGKNRDLYERLEGRHKNIKVFGYVNNVCDYMKWADAVITKPGGVTTFEAIYAEVPILALNPSLQQELYNAQYIQEMGIGTIVRGNIKQCLKQIETILASGRLSCYRGNILDLKSCLKKDRLTRILEMPLVRCSEAYYPVKEGFDIHETISFNI